MKDFFLNFFSIYNKFFSSAIYPYILFFNFLLILYLFLLAVSGFFRVLISFLFLVNTALLLSFFNADFFAALVLTAELPILLVLLIFYFQKNSLQIDNIYNYATAKNFTKPFTGLLVFFVIFFINSDTKCNFLLFYNFILSATYSISSRNDFLLFYILYYKSNPVYTLLFAILIFFVSLLIIFFFQIYKIYSIKTTNQVKNVLFLRKQNMLKQAVFTSKLKFFNKKINAKK